MDLRTHFDTRFAEIEAKLTTPAEDQHPVEQHRLPDGRTGHYESPSRTSGKVEHRLLNRLGLDPELLAQLQTKARAKGADLSHVLCSTGVISETDYFTCLADTLGLTYADCPVEDGDQILAVPTGNNLHRMARAVSSDAVEETSLQLSGNATLYLSPDLHELAALEDLLSRNPRLRHRIRISRRSSNMQCLINRGRLVLLSWAKNALNSNCEPLSAKTVITATQAVLIAVAVQILVIWWATTDGAMQMALHLLLSVCFVGGAGLRLYACMHHKVRGTGDQKLSSNERYNEDQFPVYSVLACLYQEANQVDDLVNSLLQLDWPRESLEIKLVCEVDDPETIAACRACISRVETTCVELIIVPYAHPRTKPKALNYALPLCRGEFLVVYDAEDRPGRSQLKEAFYQFQNGPADIACLQAPLVIHNYRESYWSALMTAEFSAQFQGLLPALETLRLPFPLGGTSNHFKRRVLIRVGAWDPYNVTEDADLGIRLARSGYRSGTLSCPTHEEAPIRFKDWFGQRTRWFKGWLQTWLVHMRHPVNLMKELGLRGTFAFHILITAVVIGLLIHPFLYYHLLTDGFGLARSEISIWRAAVLGIDSIALILTYLSMVALAIQTLPSRKLSVLSYKLWLLPVYWLLMSLAAWCALWELCRRPHHWQKTPHHSLKPDIP